jgi:ATP-binding cassette subfamily B protein
VTRRRADKRADRSLLARAAGASGAWANDARASSAAGARHLARGAWYLLVLGARLDRRRLFRAMVLMFSGYLAAPFSALALAAFTNDALGRHPAPALVMAILVAVLLVAQLMCSHFAHLDYFELAEMQYAHLHAELMELVQAPPTVAHLDSSVFADDVQLVKEGLFNSTRSLEAVLQLMGLVLQTAATAVILVRLNPWLAFLPFMALPPVWAGNRAEAIMERAREASAEALRLNRHLLELATSAASVKELRLVGAEAEVLARQGAAWDRVTRLRWRGQARSAGVRAAGQVFFALAYGGAILAVVDQAGRSHTNVGNLVLVITLAVQVSTQVSGALSLLALLQSSSYLARRMDALRAAAGPESPVVADDDGVEHAVRSRRASRAKVQGHSTTGPSVPTVPDRLQEGIVLDEVSFAYPGSCRPVLERVSLTLPAGQALALVGENGAGKSTLVKLLCGMYTPTSGRILVDGVELGQIEPEAWRARVAALFQDFYRIELTLRESTGLGSLARFHDDERVRRALVEARAERVLAHVTGGLDGFVGRGYDDGLDLSGGQWQTVALSRCLMRDNPLLLVLDEPAAALDASAEHAIFERYASSAKTAGEQLGSVTVLVSHRFSTVLMASSIAVLQKGKLIEHGPHRQLMAAGGLYAELFQLQQRAYR